MMRLIKILGATAGTAAFLFVLGFILFVGVVDGYAPGRVPKADAIVALTGGGARIPEALRLLSEGNARRLLISGVNRQTTKDELKRLTGLESRMFDCCVDIGYQALDTIGNADEARAWMGARGYSSLIVVTANYHMPRSLMEIARAMPEVRLVPYPVYVDNFRMNHWWEKRASARLLVLEYLKFLPAAARYVATKLAHGEQPFAVVEPRPIGAGDSSARS